MAGVSWCRDEAGLMDDERSRNRSDWKGNEPDTEATVSKCQAGSDRPLTSTPKVRLCASTLHPSNPRCR